MNNKNMFTVENLKKDDIEYLLKNVILASEQNYNFKFKDVSYDNNQEDYLLITIYSVYNSTNPKKFARNDNPIYIKVYDNYNFSVSGADEYNDKIKAELLKFFIKTQTSYEEDYLKYWKETLNTKVQHQLSSTQGELLFLDSKEEIEKKVSELLEMLKNFASSTYSKIKTQLNILIKEIENEQVKNV